MMRFVIALVALSLSACASLPSAPDIARIVSQIMAVERAGVDAFCSLPPSWQGKALGELRKRAPDANIACGSITGGPAVSGVPGW